MKKTCPLVLVAALSAACFAQNPKNAPVANTGASKNSTNATQSTPQPAPSAAQGAPTSGTSQPTPAAGTTSQLNGVTTIKDAQTGITVEKMNGEGMPEDPLLQPASLPKGKVTMVGGIVSKIDPIRSRLSIAPFGTSQRMNIFFDERTHIFRDGRATTEASIHRGDRAYVDTMLDGTRVFARNVHVISQMGAAGASGQVVGYDASRGTMTVQDQISASPVTFSVSPQTVIKLKNGSGGSTANLQPGSLVAVQFAPGYNGRSTAQQIQVLAVPGESFTFTGRVTNLDLRSRMISVENQTDDKIYDIALDGSNEVGDKLQVGARVSVVATFTGKGYRANSLNVD